MAKRKTPPAEDPQFLARKAGGMELKDFEMQVDMARMRAYRLGRVQEQIRKHDLAGAVLFNSIHLRYATGTRSVQVFNMHTPYRSTFVPPTGKVIMNDWQTEGLPVLDTVAEYRPTRNFAYFPAGERHEDIARAFAKDVAALTKKHGGRNRRIAVDIIEPVGMLALQAEGLEVVSAERLMQHAKVIKSADEIACMLHTITIAEAGMGRMRRAMEPGMTENELWAILHQTNIAKGGEYFEYRLMASGGRTNPWGQECSDRMIRAGELVAFDCGMVGPYGYVADVSRTYHCGPGRPSATQRDQYRRAYDYLHHNLAMVRAGVTFRDFSRRGSVLPPQFFRNRYNMLVHSIGMADEWPSIPYKDDWQRDGYDGSLQEGMTVCVEAYFGAEGGTEGVKLEQQVLVTKTGYQALSTFPFEDDLLA
ncbi:MAG: aminopeptidase P family protein [Alphaproteobacteria bacterium]|nr:aminopeptidase P family protein [Alphaproteobacteria bacterium]